MKSYQDYMKPGVVVVFTQMWLVWIVSRRNLHVPNFIFLNVRTDGTKTHGPHYAIYSPWYQSRRL